MAYSVARRVSGPVFCLIDKNNTPKSFNSMHGSTTRFKTPRLTNYIFGKRAYVSTYPTRFFILFCGRTLQRSARRVIFVVALSAYKNKRYISLKRSSFSHLYNIQHILGFDCTSCLQFSNIWPVLF